MGEGGAAVALNDEVINSFDGDGLCLPPVGCCEGDGAGGAGVVDGDLITTADGDGDIGSGSFAEDDAVAECGGRVLAETGIEGCLLDEEELVAQSWCAVDAWEDGAGGDDAGEGGEDLPGIGGIEAIGVIDDVGVSAILKEADIAVAVGEGAGTKGDGGACGGNGAGVIGGQIEDIAAAACREVGDGVGQIALGFVEPAEGICS
jgi:hypothetical protein